MFRLNSHHSRCSHKNEFFQNRRVLDPAYHQLCLIASKLKSPLFQAAPVPKAPIASQKTSDFSAPEPVILGAGPSRGERRVKMNRMRLRIAQRLKDAQNTCAMLTTFNELDMSGILTMRKEYKVRYNVTLDQTIFSMQRKLHKSVCPLKF